MTEKTKAYIAWAMVSVIWGTTYLAIRIGVEDLPPMLFAGFRWIIAGTGFSLYLYWKGNRFPRKDELKYLFISGVSLLGVSNGLVVVAEQWIPSGLAALLMTTLPFWVVAAESFMPSGIKFNVKILTGALFGFAGVSLIFYNEYENMLQQDYLLGIILVLIAMISWAGGSIYSKYRRIDINPLMIATMQMIAAGLVQTLVGIGFGELSEFHFTTESFWAFTYLILVGSMFGYGSYIYAITHLPISFVSTYAYINPIIALFLGWLVLDEKISILLVYSTVIIIAGIWLIKKGSIRKSV